VFLPFGDTPNPRGFRPWLTWLLIAVNVLVFLQISFPLSALRPDPGDPQLRAYLQWLLSALPPGASQREALAQVSAYDLFVFEHGFRPVHPELADLFSSMFLHGGLAHLLGNMLFLWIYGDNVEHRVGRLPFLVAYLGTGVAATLVFAAFSGGSGAPLVGASGAISGVLGLYFVQFPRNRVKVFAFLWPLLMNVFLVPARLVLLAFVVIDNLLPAVLGAHSGVAYGAHLGGFAAGAVVAWAWEGGAERRKLRRAGPEPSGGAAGGDGTGARVLPLADSPARRQLLLGLMLMQDGQLPAAWQHLVRALELRPDPDTERRAREALARIAVHPKMRR
jgi:membrane associated rhomboid family serine protease